MIPDGQISQLQQRRAHRGKISAGNGFSLLELLLVMAIIIIAFTLYWGGGSRGFQIHQLANCNKNLAGIYSAMNSYSVDNNEKLPALTNAPTSEPVLSLLVPRSTTGTDKFICPGGKDKALPDAQPFTDRKISYAYYMGQQLKNGAGQPLISDRQINTNQKARGEQVFSLDGTQPGANHNRFGGNVVFCDGNVDKSLPYASFDLTNGPGVTLLNPKP